MKQKNGLAKYLSRLDVWALSLSCIIGWGAFVMPGTTFLPVAGPAGTTLAIVISALIMGVIGINYCYLMVQHPGIGGVYVYTKSAFGRGHAFLSAWFLCLSYLVLIPANATALAVMFRALFNDVVERGIHYQIAGYDMYLREAVISVTVLVGIGLLAMYCKPFLQRALTGLAIILIAGVISLTGIILTKIPLHNILAGPGFSVVNPFVAVLSIVVLAPWAFVGFEVISLETAHFQFPVKKSKWIIGIAIALGGFIYIAMCLVAVSVVPDGYASWQEYIDALGQFRGYAALPTFYAAKELLGSAGLALIGVTATAAVISGVIGFYRATCRILTNLADDSILSRFFANPRHCYLFIMAISITVSLLGRTALAWFVDLSSFGAIVGFGYVSSVVLKTAKLGEDKRYVRFGTTGIVISAVFAVTQLLPYLSAIEAMEAESYLLLGLWCMLGFAFYWRTMLLSAGTEQESETVTISALFMLLFYSVLVWYIKSLVGSAEAGIAVSTVIRNSVVLAVLALLGLLFMLLIASHLKKRQEILESERIRAIESSNAKSQFLFNMSHDIRTPMNAIIGYTNLALKEEMSGTVRDFLGKIETSGRHLMALINDILEMSRIESGKIELEYEPADICRIAEGIRDLFMQQMKQKNIDFSVHTAQVSHRYVWCDRKNLNRVLFNLVGNAYKFTPEGGTVTASVWENSYGEDDFGSYELRVKDNGIGISKEFIGKMFNAFERERTSTDSKIEGTGLGLAITKSIIDLMGGTIDVISSPGAGTEMIIRIRFQLARQKDFTAETTKEEDGAQEGLPDFSGRRLLLVEDNEINREIAVMILTQAGFTVETAEDGQVAVGKVSSSAPGYYDAVLMDIQMPVMNGYEATKTIRALEDKALAGIPVIAMTANAFKEDIQAAEEAGMQAHIAKPLDIETMMKTLAQVLGKKNR